MMQNNEDPDKKLNPNWWVGQMMLNVLQKALKDGEFQLSLEAKCLP